MACGCGRSRARAGVITVGFEVTYPNGTVSDPPFLTVLEAQREIIRSGGGTIRKITRKQD